MITGSHGLCPQKPVLVRLPGKAHALRGLAHPQRDCPSTPPPSCVLCKTDNSWLQMVIAEHHVAPEHPATLEHPVTLEHVTLEHHVAPEHVTPEHHVAAPLA